MCVFIIALLFEVLNMVIPIDINVDIWNQYKYFQNPMQCRKYMHIQNVATQL